VLEKLKDFVSILIYGGSTKFNSGEIAILTAVYNALPDNEKEIFEEQRNSVKLVQRQHPGRLVMAYYRKSANVSELPYSGYEYCLAEVKYKNSNRTKNTNVVLHDGLLQSLERAVPKDDTEIDKIINVTLHPKKYKSIADEIDAEEHSENA
jgi:hypothetical protein